MLRALWTLSLKDTLSKLGVRRSDCLHSCRILGSEECEECVGPIWACFLGVKGVLGWADLGLFSGCEECAGLG